MIHTIKINGDRSVVELVAEAGVAVRVAAAYLDDRMPDAVDYVCGPATPAVEMLRGRAVASDEAGCA